MNYDFMSIIQRKPFITALYMKKLILNTSALKSNRTPIKCFLKTRGLKVGQTIYFLVYWPSSFSSVLVLNSIWEGRRDECRQVYLKGI